MIHTSLLSILRRKATDILLETGGEIRRSIISHHKTDFGNRILTFLLELTSTVKTYFMDKINSRFSYYSLQLQMEIGTAHIHLAGELLR